MKVKFCQNNQKYLPQIQYQWHMNSRPNVTAHAVYCRVLTILDAITIHVTKSAKINYVHTNYTPIHYYLLF